jgi:hypothetical protein
LFCPSYGSDPFTYHLAAALERHPGSRDPQITYGYGYPTRSKLGKVIEPAPPTLAQLQRQADRFGANEVYEVGQTCLSEVELAELRAHLASLEPIRYRDRTGRLRLHRRSVGVKPKKAEAALLYGKAVEAVLSGVLLLPAAATKHGLTQRSLKRLIDERLADGHAVADAA